MINLLLVADNSNIIMEIIPENECGKGEYFYRPRSKGDNVLGSVRPSVHLSVSA